MRYNNNPRDTDEILELFVSPDFFEQKMEDNLEKIAFYYGKHTRHKYHMISRFVYKKMQNGEDAIEYLLDNINSMLDFIKYEKEESRKIVKNVADDLKIEKVILSLEKLYDHIALEEEKWNIEKHIKMKKTGGCRKVNREKSKRVYERLEKVLLEENGTYEETKNAVDKLREIYLNRKAGNFLNNTTIQKIASDDH